MTRKTTMLCSAAAFALIGAMIGPAPSALADPVPAAASYADLLEPVPDARARLQADDAMADDKMVGNARMIPAGLNIGLGINLHHHHHHHHHSARWYRGHGYYWNGRFWMQGPPPPPPYWHHHHADWYRGNGYSWDGRVWIAPRVHHHHHHHHHWR
jgi:hypothetical protein